MIVAALLLAMADLAPFAGFYHSNQIEVGAALQLDEDGKFQYQLDYGAVSEAAEGNWSTDGNVVYLTATRIEGAYKTRNFSREPLRIEVTACCSPVTTRSFVSSGGASSARRQ
jgi:hypothetical protein